VTVAQHTPKAGTGKHPCVLRRNARSLLFPMLAHSLANTAFHLSALLGA
jgi:hypothetical protein